MRIVLLVIALLLLAWGFWILSGGSGFRPSSDADPATLAVSGDPPPGPEEADAVATETPAPEAEDPDAVEPDLADPDAPPSDPTAPETPAEAPEAPPAVEPEPEPAPAAEASPTPEAVAEPAPTPDPVPPEEPLQPSDALAAIAPDLARPAPPPVRSLPEPSTPATDDGPGAAVPEAEILADAGTSAEPSDAGTAAPPADPEADPTPGADAGPASPEPDLRRITGDRVNFREGPGTGFPSQDLLALGTGVEVLEEEGDWLRVRTESGAEGWVFARFVADADD